MKQFSTLIIVTAIIAMFFSMYKTSDYVRIPLDVSTDGFPVSATISDNELRCLQRAIFFEARNQSQAGQVAVGFTVMNRVDAPQYRSDTICGIVSQSAVVRGKRICQFSWYCDGKREPNLARKEERKAWKRAETLADLVYMGKIDNPVGNATMFHADYVQPSWRKSFDKVAHIDDHIFYQVAGN